MDLKHPNCPRCTKGLKNYRESTYIPLTVYQVVYLKRIYERINGVFKGIGWKCKICDFIVLDNFSKSGRRCIQQRRKNKK